MKTRQSNFELMRIFAMLAIVAGHACMFASESGPGGGLARWSWLIVGSAPRLAVNVFLMIGCWFMVDAAFSARRWLSLYLSLAVYSVGLTVIAVVCGVDVAWSERLRGLLPLCGRGCWFVSAYLFLIAWTPFLRRVLSLRREAQVLLLTVFLLPISIMSTLPKAQMCFGLDLFWFAGIFVSIGCVKHSSDVTSRLRPMPCLSLGILIYLVMVGAFGATNGHPAIKNLVYQWLWDFKSLPNAISAFLIFIGFASMKPRKIQIVNLCAVGTLGVYLFHSVPVMRRFLFVEMLRVPSWASQNASALFVILVSILVFAVGSVLDAVRRRWVSPLYLNSRWFARACTWIDGFYKKCRLI